MFVKIDTMVQQYVDKTRNTDITTSNSAKDKSIQHSKVS